MNHKLGNFGAEEAGRLYQLAARAGSIEGMYSLGWMHAMGLGMPRSSNQAAAWYKLAVQKASDWQHAAPPFVALLLLPGLVALQSLQQLPAALTGFHAPGTASCEALLPHPKHADALVCLCECFACCSASAIGPNSVWQKFIVQGQ